LEKLDEVDQQMAQVQVKNEELQKQVKETAAEHRRDEAQVEAYLALQEVISALETKALAQKVTEEAKARAEEDQTLVMEIDKQKEMMEELRRMQDTITEGAKELIQEEYSKRIAAVHEDLRRERQRMWEESVLVSKEERGEPGEHPAESQLVAMNNKVYRIAQQKQEAPKPKIPTSRLKP
jgi:uncharacterized phage infection (PIP) family protein YhgE